MKRFKTSLFTGLTVGIIALSVIVSGCSSSGIPGFSERVATVNGTVITKGDYDKVYNFYKKLYKLGDHTESPANNQLIQETLKQISLNQVILNTLLKKDAEKIGVYVSDQDVEKSKEHSEKMLGGKTALDDYLKKAHLSNSEFDDKIRQDLLVDKFLTKKVGNEVKVTEADAKAYYDRNVNEFNVPERIETSHILFKVMEPLLRKDLKDKNPKITDQELNAAVDKVKAEKKAKAEKVLEEVKKDPNHFAELAKANSEDPASAQQGGDLSYLTKQGTDPAFWNAIVTAKDNTLIPQLVETIFGYHIISVKKHEPAHTISFDEAKDKIMNQLVLMKKQNALSEWVKEKKETAKIDIAPKYKPQQKTEQAGSPAGQPPAGIPPVAAPNAQMPSPENPAQTGINQATPSLQKSAKQ